MSDWMAGDPAMRNQISNSNSLLTGNFTGNFAYLACERLNPMRETPVLQSLLEQFPAKAIREYFISNRECQARRSGGLSVVRQFETDQAFREERVWLIRG
jgi:hypothetical protein